MANIGLQLRRVISVLLFTNILFYFLSLQLQNFSVKIQFKAQYVWVTPGVGHFYSTFSSGLVQQKYN